MCTCKLIQRLKNKVSIHQWLLSDPEGRVVHHLKQKGGSEIKTMIHVAAYSTFLEKNGLRKTARGSLRNRPLYKVKQTYFEKSFFLLHARMNERNHPLSFRIQLQVHTVTVTGKLRILDLYSQKYRCFFYYGERERVRRF